MKIFYKKDFQRVDGELKKLKELYGDLLEKCSNNEWEYMINTKKLTTLADDRRIKIEMLEQDNQLLKEKIKELNGSKGGLTKQVNALTKELEETKKQLAESMTNKYLVRKVRSTKPPRQRMSYKTSSKQSNIIKNIKEEL